jgi:dTDP-4-amino-4,6-dideoxygalactose transaminase
MALYGAVCIDLDELVEAITPKTNAVIVVHLSGAMYDMDKLMSIASEYRIALIKDCTHKHGSECKGKFSVTFGDFGVLFCV